MKTVKYARYVLVDEQRGLISWYESKKTAEKAQNFNGGDLFDTETEDPENLEIILHHVRKQIGVE